jgi:hypothetical protein
MGPIWEFLSKKVERSWLVAVFLVGVLLSPLMFRAGQWVFEFLTADGSEGSGLLSLRPFVWLLLLGSLVANWWFVRQVLSLRDDNEELQTRIGKWQEYAGTSAPPPPPDG